MQSVVSVKGQTVIPRGVREALGIKPGSKVNWILREGSVVVFPVPEDPVSALRGILRGKGSTADLLEERRQDFEKDEATLKSMAKRWRS